MGSLECETSPDGHPTPGLGPPGRAPTGRAQRARLAVQGAGEWTVASLTPPTWGIDFTPHLTGSEQPAHRVVLTHKCLVLSSLRLKQPVPLRHPTLAVGHQVPGDRVALNRTPSTRVVLPSACEWLRGFCLLLLSVSEEAHSEDSGSSPTWHSGRVCARGLGMSCSRLMCWFAWKSLGLGKRPVSGVGSDP